MYISIQNTNSFARKHCAAPEWSRIFIHDMLSHLSRIRLYWYRRACWVLMNWITEHTMLYPPDCPPLWTGCNYPDIDTQWWTARFWLMKTGIAFFQYEVIPQREVNIIYYESFIVHAALIIASNAINLFHWQSIPVSQRWQKCLWDSINYEYLKKHCQ